MFYTAYIFLFLMFLFFLLVLLEFKILYNTFWNMLIKLQIMWVVELVENVVVL